MAAIAFSNDDQFSVDIELKKRKEAMGRIVARYIALATLLFGIGDVILWFISHEENEFPISAFFMVLPFIGAFLLAPLYAQNYHRLGNWIFLVTSLVVLVISPLTVSEVTTMIVAGFIALSVFSNLLLYERESAVFTAICIAALIATLTMNEFLSASEIAQEEENLEKVIDILLTTTTISAILLILRSIIFKQEDSFRQAQLLNREIEHRAAGEQNLRQRLQEAVSHYVQVMAVVAKGNLAARVETPRVAPGKEDDPLLVLGGQLNDTISSLQTMIGQIHAASKELTSASAEILAATSQQAAGANEQSAAVSQTITTVEEVKTITEQAVSRSQEVVAAAQRATAVSRTGQQAVQETIESMNQIKARVQSIAENILVLSQQTQQIGQIITSVNELTAQSNLLALNAAIEAARAGEHGRGFAVVAAEVRSLAVQSRQATDQVRDILQDIQKATNTSVMVTEEGSKVVEQGVRLAGRSRQAIEQLGCAIDEAAERVMQVMAGGQQQTAGMEQISLAIRNVQQVAIQSLAATRQAEKAAQDLNNLAHSLDETVTLYQA